MSRDFKKLDEDVQRRIIEAANNIRKKYLALKAAREEVEGKDKKLRNSRGLKPDPETIQQIGDHTRKLKELYDSLKAGRYENARALESTYRPLAKILSLELEKNKSKTFTTPKKTPASAKRYRSASKLSPTLVKKPRYPLKFPDEQTHDQNEEENMETEDDENEPAPIMPNSPITQNLQDADNGDDINNTAASEVGELDRTFYEYTPQESFFYDDELRLDPNLHPIHTDHIPDESFDEYLEQYDELPREYVRGLIRDTCNNFDRTYLRHDYATDHIYFGDSKLEFKGPDIKIKGELFKGTPGLYELIFKTVPLRNKFTALDERAFAKIISLTNANKRNFKPDEPNVGNRGVKYTHTIKPILERIIRAANEAKQLERDKQLRIARKEHPKGYGLNFTNDQVDVAKNDPPEPEFKVVKGSLPPIKLLTNNEIDYVYWDDPNQLVDRLRLLHASASAGNNNLYNEMLSIEKELREADIIE